MNERDARVDLDGRTAVYRMRLADIGGVIVVLCVASVGFAKPAFEWVPIKTLPYFDDAQAQLQMLVDSNGHRTINRLCVIGQRDGKSSQAYVYWPAENKLILWTPDVTDPATLVHSRRYLDLKRDVVRGDDVHGSTYLLSQRFVNETLGACAVKGEYFMIVKSAGEDAGHGSSKWSHPVGTVKDKKPLRLVGLSGSQAALDFTLFSIKAVRPRRITPTRASIASKSTYALYRFNKRPV